MWLMSAAAYVFRQLFEGIMGKGRYLPLLLSIRAADEAHASIHGHFPEAFMVLQRFLLVWAAAAGSNIMQSCSQANTALKLAIGWGLCGCCRG